MTILALDLGKKRTGVALSHGVVAQGYTTLQFNENQTDSLINALKKIINEQSVDKIIIGLPLGKDGKDTTQSIWTKSITEKIRGKLDVEIDFAEESYSTSQAAVENGDVDQQSAKIILEQYLNETRSKPL